MPVYDLPLSMRLDDDVVIARSRRDLWSLIWAGYKPTSEPVLEEVIPNVDMAALGRLIDSRVLTHVNSLTPHPAYDVPALIDVFRTSLGDPLIVDPTGSTDPTDIASLTSVFQTELGGNYTAPAGADEPPLLTSVFQTELGGNYTAPAGADEPALLTSVFQTELGGDYTPPAGEAVPASLTTVFQTELGDPIVPDASTVDFTPLSTVFENGLI